jgi:hypothetical protein
MPGGGFVKKLIAALGQRLANLELRVTRLEDRLVAMDYHPEPPPSTKRPDPEFSVSPAPAPAPRRATSEERDQINSATGGWQRVSGGSGGNMVDRFR